MFIKLAALIFTLIWTDANAGPKGEGHPLGCYVGLLSQTQDGAVVFDNSTLVPCPNISDICVKYDISTLDYGTKFTTQSGICLNASLASQDLCKLASDFTNRTFLNCTAQACNSTWCNRFKEPEFCPKHTDNDIKFLPNCSFRQTLREVQTCAQLLFQGYPYLNQHKCLNNLDRMASCLAGVAKRCIKGPCFTVFDTYLYTRDYFRAIQSYPSPVNTYDDVLTMVESIVGQSEIISGLRSMAEEYICPIHGYPAPLPTLNEIMIGSLPNQVCDEYFLRNLTAASLEIWRNFYIATTQQQLCVSFRDFATRVKTMISARCDLTQLPGFVKEFVTGIHEPLQPVLTKAIKIIQDIFNNVTLPECGKAGPLIECSHYYHSTRICKQRKAWFCDYVKWRWEVVQQGIPAYLRWVEENGLKLPHRQVSCLKVPMSELCLDPLYGIRCIRDSAKCAFCWCENQDYKNPEFMVKHYRNDLGEYSKFVEGYKYVDGLLNQGCTYN